VIALQVYEDLSLANDCLILADDLHVVYQVYPLGTCRVQCTCIYTYEPRGYHMCINVVVDIFTVKDVTSVEGLRAPL